MFEFSLLEYTSLLPHETDLGCHPSSRVNFGVTTIVHGFIGVFGDSECIALGEVSEFFFGPPLLMGYIKCTATSTESGFLSKRNRLSVVELLGKPLSVELQRQFRRRECLRLGPLRRKFCSPRLPPRRQQQVQKRTAGGARRIANHK